MTKYYDYAIDTLHERVHVIYGSRQSGKTYYENNISESLSYDLAKAKIEELEEENKKIKKELELEINNSNIMSAQIKDKKIQIEQLNERINKAIEYIEKELNCTPSSNRKEVGLILVDYKKLLKLLKGE